MEFGGGNEKAMRNFNFFMMIGLVLGGCVKAFPPKGEDSDTTDTATDTTDTATDTGDTTTDTGTDSGDCDDTDAATWYADDDADGYGDEASTTLACAAPTGYVADATDCNDADATVNPGAAEICNGMDNDCDSEIDEDATDAVTWYADMDGDTYGDPSTPGMGCAAPTGYVADATDCDDVDATVNLGATEICNGMDDDCDVGTDDADAEGAADATLWYADADLDGYGDATEATVACVAPTGYVANNTDCDDSDAGINPAEAEVCNGADDDCDGEADEDAIDALTWYADSDGDGYGDLSTPSLACTQPTGTVGNNTDCNDADAGINPDAAEECDSMDNNCNGTVDEDATDALVWYADSDSDGYGDATEATVACAAPAGFVADSTDCDDSDAGINPAEAEVCNGADDDCDGGVDDADIEGAADASLWYADSDSDGYGDATEATVACAAPANYVADATDCDDADPTVNPEATEICNTVDDDCDGGVDEGVTTAYYLDLDLDGYGDAEQAANGCAAPANYVADDTDCDDADAGVNPSAAEVCNGADDDCDSAIDEDATDAITWYADSDGDTYGEPDSGMEGCEAPHLGDVLDDTDCDDTDPAWFWACTPCERELVEDIGFFQESVWPGDPSDEPGVITLGAQTAATAVGIRWVDGSGDDWVTCGDVVVPWDRPATAVVAVQVQDSYLAFGWSISGGVSYVPSDEILGALIAGASYQNTGDLGGNAILEP